MSGPDVRDVGAVAIVDYGMGNLFSVSAACRHEGIDAVVTSAPDDLDRCRGLVLPGVGAFGEAMDRLRSSRLDRAIVRAIDRGVPVLAVCLGMQLLLERSEEFGAHAGLGVVPGQVVPLPTPQRPSRARVPHMGWERIRPVGPPDRWRSSPLSVIGAETHMYFVHSMKCVPDTPDVELAHADFDGSPFCAALAVANVTACQFHPERSGNAGLSLYRAVFAPAEAGEGHA